MYPHLLFHLWADLPGILSPFHRWKSRQNQTKTSKSLPNTLHLSPSDCLQPPTGEEPILPLPARDHTGSGPGKMPSHLASRNSTSLRAAHSFYSGSSFVTEKNLLAPMRDQLTRDPNVALRNHCLESQVVPQLHFHEGLCNLSLNRMGTSSPRRSVSKPSQGQHPSPDVMGEWEMG